MKSTIGKRKSTSSFAPEFSRQSSSTVFTEDIDMEYDSIMEPDMIPTEVVESGSVAEFNDVSPTKKSTFDTPQSEYVYIISIL